MTTTPLDQSLGQQAADHLNDAADSAANAAEAVTNRVANAIEGGAQSAQTTLRTTETTFDRTASQTASAVRTTVTTEKPVITATTPPPPPPPLETRQEEKSSGSGGCLTTLWGGLLGALLGIVLTLGFLYLTNQGLRYAPKSLVTSLQATVTAYESNAGELRADVNTLQGNLSASQQDMGTLQDDVVGIGAAQAEQLRRLDDLTGQASALEESVGVVSDTLDIVATDVATLTQQMEVVSATATRSQRFMSGMQALLTSVMSDEPTTAISGTHTMTPTAPLSVTLPLTGTMPITTTLPLSVTPRITVTTPFTIEGRLPLTSTTVVTATSAPSTTLSVTTTVGVTATNAVTSTTAPSQPVPMTPFAPPAAGMSAVRGMVFLDADKNGMRNADTEKGIANVRVTLYSQSRTVISQANTDLQGMYNFTDLTPGIYIVVETDPAGFVSSTPNVLTVVLRSSRVAENINFGDYPRR